MLDQARAVGADLALIIAGIQASLESAPIRRQEYEVSVHHLSQAGDEERIPCDAALACRIGTTRQILDPTRIRPMADSGE